MEEPAAEPEPDHGTDAASNRAHAVAHPASRRLSRSAFDWCFRSRITGQITIAQFPNLPLWLFVASVVLRQVLPVGTSVHSAVSWLGAIALGWWALDEVIRGVNPWRRLLGLAGSGFAVLDVAALLR